MDLLNRMFGAIGQNLNDILIISIDEKKVNEENINESKKILSSYILKVKPKFFFVILSYDRNIAPKPCRKSAQITSPQGYRGCFQNL